MNKLKIGIVGCGSIGKRHIAVVDAQEHTELVAICDTDQKKAQEQSALYNGIDFYAQYADFLSKIQADVIHICTPHHLHYPMTIQALDAGFHVLVEKPMCLDVSNGLKMIQRAQEVGKKLFVVKQNRFNVPVKLFSEAHKAQRLGKILMVKCDVLWNRHQPYYDDSDWRGKIKTEGGALYTQASHFIDLLIWWFGDVHSVSAHLDTKTHTIEIEDCGAAILNFKSGVICSLNWTTSVYNKNYEGSITIIGEKGTVKIGGQYLNKIEYWDVASFPLREGISFDDQPNAYGKYQGTSSNHHKVVEQMVKDFNSTSFSLVEGPEGLKSIEVIDKIYQVSKHANT